jgi:hypothetical protein
MVLRWDDLFGRSFFALLVRRDSLGVMCFRLFLPLSLLCSPVKWLTFRIFFYGGRLSSFLVEVVPLGQAVR